MKTSELIGPALDWAVAKCEGRDWPDNAAKFLGEQYYNPSTDWSHGGPISEREGISATRNNDLYFPSGNEKGEHYEQYWKATIDLNEGDAMIQINYGPTELIAKMRCFVASKLGDYVEIPEELQ